MPQPNYHHLHLFWSVVREGGVGKAAKRLGLSQSTVSTQLRTLEEQGGAPLFTRVGRELVLTDAGRTAYSFAEEIFALGAELDAALRGARPGVPTRVAIGLSDAVPKALAARLLEAVLALPDSPRLLVHEDRTERLLQELVNHRLDAVITDAPMHPAWRVRAFHHPLGETGVSFCAAPPLARRLRDTFPASLHDAPLLLPTEHAAIRHPLDLWFEAQKVVPRVVAEVDDPALLKTLGRAGIAAFPVPTALAEELCGQYGVEVVGATAEVRERFYAITVERRVRHPAVLALTAAAGRALPPEPSRGG